MAVAKLNNERTLKALQTKLPQEDIRDSTWASSGAFGVRVSRTGRKVFFLMYVRDGRRRRFNLGEYPSMTLSDAKAAALQTLVAVKQGRDPQREKHAYKLAETVSEIFELYCRHKEGKVARSTIVNSRSMFAKHVAPRIGAKKAVDVKKSHVLDIINDIAHEQKKPYMSNRVKELISAVFNHAIDQGLLEVHQNPCFRVKDAGVEKVGERFLSTDEVRSYWLQSESASATDRAFFRLLLMLGARPGEIMKLRWADIDGEVLTLRAANVKTRNTHELFLSPVARAEIQRLRVASKGSEYLFPSASGVACRSCFQEAHRNFLAAMGCPRWTLRDIRRTVETHMRRIGISGLAVNEVLNHARGEIRTHYDKNSYFAEKKAALNQWARWIETNASGTTSTVVELRELRRAVND